MMSRMGLVSPSHYGTRASHIPTSLLRLVLLKFSPWVSGLVFPTISVSRGSCSPISSCLPFGFPLGARVPHFASLRIWDSCIPFFPSTFGARDPRFGFYCSPMELVFSNCLILNFFITATAFAFLGLVFPAVGSRKIHFPAFDAQPFCTFTSASVYPSALFSFDTHGRISFRRRRLRWLASFQFNESSSRQFRLFSVLHMSFSSYTPAFNILNCRFTFAPDSKDGLFSR